MYTSISSLLKINNWFMLLIFQLGAITDVAEKKGARS